MRYFVAILCVCLSACNPLAKFETPSVRLADLKLLEREGFEQRFALGLLIANPNAMALPVKGMQYRVAINGQEVFRGFSEKLPAIAARSETYVEIQVSANLLNAGSLLMELVTQNNPRLDYALNAAFDLTGLLLDFNVNERGSLNLSQ